MSDARYKYKPIILFFIYYFIQFFCLLFLALKAELGLFIIAGVIYVAKERDDINR